MDFRDVDIRDIVPSIAEITGRNFVLSDRVKGKVTIISPAPVTIDEAYQAFLSALKIKKLCTVEVGSITKIVSERECKTSSIPRSRSDQSLEDLGDQPITQLVRLKHIEANEINRAIKPLVSKTSGSIVAYGPTNTLIITDSASNIRRLMDMIQKLDQPGFKASVEVIPLQHSQAEDMAEKLNRIFQQKKTTTTRSRLSSRRSSDVQSGSEVRDIMPDKRTNSLIVKATREGLEEVLDLIEVLDDVVEVGKGPGRIHFKYLQHSDAEEVAKILSGLIGGTTSKTTGSRSQGEKSEAPRSSTLDRRDSLSSLAPKTSSTSNTNEGGKTFVKASGGIFEDEVRVVADPATNALIIAATPTDYQSLTPIIEQLDIRRSQVFVETLIMEVRLKKLREYGLSGHGGGQAGNNTIFGGSQLGDVTSAMAGTKEGAGALASKRGLIVGSAAKGMVELIPGSKLMIPINGGLFRALPRE